MSESERTVVGETPSPTPEEEAQEEGKKRSPATMTIMVFGAMMLVIVVIMLLGVIIALADRGAAPTIGAIRDIFIIGIALEGILIGGALILLVTQLANLTNLLQNEIKPILKSLVETTDTVKGTAQFVSQNVSEPLIEITTTLTFIKALLANLFGIRRAVRRTGKPKADKGEKAA